MKAKSLFGNYLKKLAAVAQRGDAREESFYPALAETMTEAARAQTFSARPAEN